MTESSTAVILINDHTERVLNSGIRRAGKAADLRNGHEAALESILSAPGNGMSPFSRQNIQFSSDPFQGEEGSGGNEEKSWWRKIQDIFVPVANVPEPDSDGSDDDGGEGDGDGGGGPGPAAPVNPPILDLDGGGGGEAGGVAFFGHGGDGFMELTRWVGADNGLLPWDRNGNGVIDDDDGGEHFGDETVSLQCCFLVAQKC